MLLVYPPHVLHEPRQLGVVLRKLRAPRLGEGGRGPAAALQGSPQLRRDWVVEALINNFHHVQLGSDPGIIDAAAVMPETLLNWDEDGLGEREDAEEWDAMFAEDSEEEEED